jgi:virginiamycin A acetyltransferase
MIINNIAANVNTVLQTSNMTVDLSGKNEPFPILTIGRGSFIVNAQIQSTINFDVIAGRHNIQIGQFCSLADNITFMVDMNHDYSGITTSGSSLVTSLNQKKSGIPHKAQILIQNDVWIGHGATIMSGVTLRNGAVIATNSHVTKDVPPYAIVGGNPAKIIKYRFAAEQIAELQNIAWWEWSDAELETRRADFQLPMGEFVDRYSCSRFVNVERERERGKILFFADFAEPYPIWKKVVRSYCEKYGASTNRELMLYIPKDGETSAKIALLKELLSATDNGNNSNIVVQVGNISEEAQLFAISDYYVTSRAFETVLRSCLADRFGVKTLSGVDEPLFREVE